MTNLDDKLLEILNYHFGRGGVEAIAQIHQAFTDEGYLSPKAMDEIGERQLDFGHRWGFMTGQEWHNRFLKEYRSLSPKSYSKDQYAKMAAKKVAGLK